jgi:hypothetical protein
MPQYGGQDAYSTRHCLYMTAAHIVVVAVLLQILDLQRSSLDR